MFLSLVFLLSLCAGVAVLTGSIIPVAVRAAVRHGLVDRPDAGRKGHDRPVPPIGGLVIVPLFLMLLPVLGFSPITHWPLFASLIAVAVMGYIDDRYELGATHKLVGQVVVALLLTLSGEALLTHLGFLFGNDHPLELLWLAVPFTAVCFIFFMNAMNMIDGVDGLAGSLSFIMFAILGAAAVLGQDWVHGSVALVMMAIVGGFLVHNMRYPGHKRATVFLGDAGSLSLGIIIAWLGVNIAMNPTSAMPPIVMAFIILLPIADTFALFIARVRAGRGAFVPGQDHLHHRLLVRGLMPGQVSVVMMVTVALFGFGALGALMAGVPQWMLTVLWCVLLLGHTGRLLIRGTRPVDNVDKTAKAP